MEQQQYPNNSDKAREQQDYANKRVGAPAVNGGVQIKKKTWLDHFREFFGLSECHSFRDYVSTVSDMTNRVYGAVDTLLGGRPQPPNGSVPAARISYANYYNTPLQQPQQGNAQQRLTSMYSYADIEFDRRADAETVLYRMMELLSMYHSVSVGDMFDLAGITSPNGYTDQKFGWTDVSMARVVPVGGKFRIYGLPTPTQVA